MTIATRALLPVLIVFAAPSSSAIAAERYVAAAIGPVQVSEKNDGDSTVSVLGSLGWRWERFGVEFGLQQTRGIEREIDDRDTDGPLLDFDTDVLAARLGGTVRQEFGRHWHLDARVGALVWNLDGDVEICGGGLITPYRCERRDIDRSGVDYYAGLGVGFDVDARWSVGLGWEYQRFGVGFGPAPSDAQSMTLHSVTLGSEFRF